MIRKRVRYLGRVQGVGFRATAHSIARGRPVTGWVRNEEDGSVLLEVQGEAPAVAEYLGAVRTTMGMLIRGVDENDIAPSAEEPGFEIRR